MREHKLKALIKIVEESKIDELEISRWGKKIRICKTNVNGSFSETVTPAVKEVPVVANEIVEPPPVPTSSTPAPIEEPKESVKTEETVLSDDHVEIKSPMVGTFYRRPAPEADPYVDVGDTISPGKVLCIIEAMKLMNEIESDLSGTIVKILVENAEPVEYNQPLFIVKKS